MSARPPVHVIKGGLLPTLPPSQPPGADYWVWARTAAGALGRHDDLAVARLRHVVRSAATLLGWLDAPESERPPAPLAVLDVSAGSGFLGTCLREQRPGTGYHITEGSDLLLTFARQRGHAEAGAVWRWEAGGEHLVAALGRAADTFQPRYPLVIACHVLDCVPDPYAFADECWRMVAPGGFLLAAVQRHLEHRVHGTGTWSWDRLLDMLAQYGQPQVTFDDAQGGNLVAAVQMPQEAP